MNLFEIVIIRTENTTLIGLIIFYDKDRRVIGKVEFEKSEKGSHTHNTGGFVPEPNSRLDKDVQAALRIVWAAKFDKEIFVWSGE